MERFNENNYVTSHFFSKIELFVVCLAVVLVVFVVVPKTKSVLKEIKINNAIDTAHYYKENVSNFYMSQLLIDTSFKLNGTYTVDNGNLYDEANHMYDVMIKGNKPTSGYLTYENNNLKSGCIVINGYSVNIDNGEMNFTDNCDITNTYAVNM